MSKVLSICIPSYNMEQYLGRCLDSMLVREVLDQIEVIVVNDGSKDGTLTIANDFKRRYPNSVVVIDKPNGHYGSCINASLKVATGKYFRIVDADDWVDSKVLVQLMETLSRIDVDCVCQKYTIKYDTGSEFTEELDMPFNEVLDLNQIQLKKSCMHMHCLIYSLDLLRRLDYVQTEGVCYTDTEYVYIPLSCARSIYFIDSSLYQYYFGREGQSMDSSVIIKNNEHYYKVIKNIARVHHSDMPFNKNEPEVFAIIMQFSMLFYALPNYILFHSYNPDMDALYRGVMSDLKNSGKLYYPNYSKMKVLMLKMWDSAGPGLSKVLMLPFRWYMKHRG